MLPARFRFNVVQEMYPCSKRCNSSPRSAPAASNARWPVPKRQRASSIPPNPVSKSLPSMTRAASRPTPARNAPRRGVCMRVRSRPSPSTRLLAPKRSTTTSAWAARSAPSPVRLARSITTHRPARSSSAIYAVAIRSVPRPARPRRSLMWMQRLPDSTGCARTPPRRSRVDAAAHAFASSFPRIVILLLKTRGS